MKKILKFFGWLVASVIVLAGIVFFIAWKSPKYYVVKNKGNYPFLPFKDYNGEHPRPYIIEKENLVIFGAQHTRNPKDAEIGLIETKWKKLQPTIALVEGRLGFLLPMFMDPVEKLGEGGKVKELAERKGISIYNWDLSKEELAKKLQEKFSREQIALAQILNPYFGNLRFGKPSSPEDYVKPFLKRAAFVQMENQFQSVEDVDRAWKKYFPKLDWRNVSDEYTLPGYLNDMLAFNNDLRNRQLITAVKELSAKGERVFVICGSSHAFCIEPAFR